MITMRLHANYKRGLHAKFCWQTAIFEDERSEEHTSELQSPCNLVCRLLLEKKKKKNIISSRAGFRHRRRLTATPPVNQFSCGDNSNLLHVPTDLLVVVDRCIGVPQTSTTTF